MTIDEPMILVATKDQRKPWAAPRVILGTLSDAEGGSAITFKETTRGSGALAS